MKYIYTPKDDDSKAEEITKEDALIMLRNSYQDVEYVLGNAEKIFGNRIALQFGNIEIVK
jgi:hypothetical protein